MVQSRYRGTTAARCGYRPNRTAVVLLALVLLAPNCSNGENDAAVPDDGQTEANEPEAATANGLSPEPLPTVGPFSAVATGRRHTCAIRSDGAIECWGGNDAGQADPPEGRFVELAAGGRHNCAIRADGGIECWGYGHDGQLDAPDGHYVSLSAGNDHSCAVRVDGDVNCWGGENAELLTPPGGHFEAVATSGQHSCVLRGGGAVQCWGRQRLRTSRRARRALHLHRCPRRILLRRAHRRHSRVLGSALGRLCPQGAARRGLPHRLPRRLALLRTTNRRHHPVLGIVAVPRQLRPCLVTQRAILCGGQRH